LFIVIIEKGGLPMLSQTQLKMVLAAIAIATAGPVFASTIASVETQATGTSAAIGQTGDPTPVVTSILSLAGSYTEGALSKTYTSDAFLVNDGTGSLEFFGTPAALGYTPTVGDGLSATATYSPFHLIPEVASPFAITKASSGNTVPGATVTTIPAVNVAVTPENLAGYLLELDNVTISSGTSVLTPGETFGTTNLTLTITDGSSNAMTMFYYESSYSAAFVNLANMVIPSGPVNMTGFVDVFTSGTTSTPEFNPITITVVPEPASLTLLGLGAIAILSRRRRA
jgi:hypothetical protein